MAGTIFSPCAAAETGKPITADGASAAPSRSSIASAASVKVDMQTYPYGAVTYGKLFLLRESNITSYEFESSCRLVEVERSPSNPHGMMIEKFLVTKSDNLGTRKRN